MIAKRKIQQVRKELAEAQSTTEGANESSATDDPPKESASPEETVPETNETTA